MDLLMDDWSAASDTFALVSSCSLEEYKTVASLNDVLEPDLFLLIRGSWSSPVEDLELSRVQCAVLLIGESSTGFRRSLHATMQ